jgi:DNA-damage-inducible protein J
MTQGQTTTVNVRVDESVKRNVEALFYSMGLNISTAINMFFRQCLLEEALPFQPKAKRGTSLKEAFRAAQLETVGLPGMMPDKINGLIVEARKA